MTYDLTVIIPVYNMENLLSNCLDSIVEQNKLDECSLLSLIHILGKPCLNHSLYRRNPTLSLRYHRELHFKDFPRNQETAGVYC